MAEMIPDRIPSNASKGEKTLFSILQNLPDDYIVYYEPIIKQRYPDFIVIAPDLGLMTIEVKGWYPKHIFGGDQSEIVVNTRGQQELKKHPIRQAKGYMNKLMDACRSDRNSQILLQDSGPNIGKFIFPFGHFAVLSNITQENMTNHPLGDLFKIFPRNKTLTRDMLSEWEDYDEEQLKEGLAKFFDPVWRFPRLNEQKVDLIRQIIHPEIKLIVPDSSKLSQKVFRLIENKLNSRDDNEKIRVDKNNLNVKVLDLKQENNARNLGNGHRIIYGVAGSGKTVLLISKAKLLAQDETRRILVLCFNVSLAYHLRHLLSEHFNIDVLHFDGWSKKNDIVREIGEINEFLGERFLNLLQNGYGDSEKYDAVLIDEAQDFANVWFKCALEAMKNPLDGDLLIVGDASQGLYPKGRLSWKEIGIQAQGRTMYKRFDLGKNYRNSKEIISLAALFSSQDTEDEDDIRAISVKPELAVRETNILPLLVKSQNREIETESVLNIVSNLFRGYWNGNKIEPLMASEIGILYPLLRKANLDIFRKFREKLSNIAPYVWLNNPEDKEARQRVAEEGVKIQTIHSSKGLQYKAVIILWADELPRNFDNTDIDLEKKLFYVGLTRAEDYLAISYSNHSNFISTIEGSNLVNVV